MPRSASTGKVLAAAPNRPGLHFRIGRVLLAQAGQPGGDASALTARAREQFELELQRDPTNANAAYELGELQRRAGELEKAVASFGAAVHSDPGFPGCARRSRPYADHTESRERGRSPARTSDDARSGVGRRVLPPLAGLWRGGKRRRAAARARDLHAAASTEAWHGSIGEGRPDVTKQDLPGVPRGGGREKE